MQTATCVAAPPVRILVVDDMVTYRKVITSVLSDLPGVEVVGVAANGKIALDRIRQLEPDLLTLDLEMPELDGLGVLKALRESGSQVQSIILSSISREGADVTLRALSLGALDFVLKPSGSSFEGRMDELRRHLGSKIDAFLHSRLRAPGIGSGHPSTAAAMAAAMPATPNPVRVRGGPATIRIPPKADVVAIGISTGGPVALATMLPMLPADLGTPVLIVQHMPPVFTKSLAEDLDRRCHLSVREGESGQPVESGCVYVAPGGKQMKVVQVAGRRVLAVTDDPAENSCRPSVDYLFRSVAESYGSRALGVIMTGMGNDGALGCRALKRRNATLLIQDAASCVVYGMPRQPTEEGLADAIEPLERIAERITRFVKGLL